MVYFTSNVLFFFSQEKKYGTPVLYKQGDQVGIRVDDRTRRKHDPFYIPCLVRNVHVPEDEIDRCDVPINPRNVIYRLQCKAGVLHMTHRWSELLDIRDLNFPELNTLDIFASVPTRCYITMKRAAEEAIGKSQSAYRPTCRCTTGCENNRCKCKKNNLPCTKSCHRFRECNNMHAEWSRRQEN